jgi:hypothetical protein
MKLRGFQNAKDDFSYDDWWLFTTQTHRNLSTRTSMFVLMQHTFLAKKTCLLISTLDEVIYYKGTFLQCSTKPLCTKQSRLETS